MEYYSTAMSINELQQQTTILINLTKVMSSKSSQVQKNRHCMLPFIIRYGNKQNKSMQLEVRRVVASGGQWKGYRDALGWLGMFGFLISMLVPGVCSGMAIRGAAPFQFVPLSEWTVWGGGWGGRGMGRGRRREDQLFFFHPKYS